MEIQFCRIIYPSVNGLVMLTLLYDTLLWKDGNPIYLEACAQCADVSREISYPSEHHSTNGGDGNGRKCVTYFLTLTSKMDC